MTEEGSGSYPQMSANNWWALRRKFIQSMPANVTGSYLSAVLPMAERSAINNILRPLKKIGLVDQENKPTERAYKWRDDAQYPEACAEICKQIYPQELIDAFPGPSIDNRTAVERWFRNNARVGENAARKLTSFYLLLVDANPTKQEESPSSRQESSRPQGSRQRRRPKEEETSTSQDASLANSEHVRERQAESTSNRGPSLHIDVQVHISPEASAEQIDSIFASMAKHLYKGESV